MKKRVLIIVAALICALSCVVGLVACGAGDAKIDMFYVSDGVNTEPSGGGLSVEVEYGQKPDLSKYVLFLHYSDNSKKEISPSDGKVSVKYYYSPTGAFDNGEEISALPSDMNRGGYTVEYTYDGNADLKARLLISVYQAEGGNFTLRIARSTVYDNELQPAVSLLNPNNLHMEKAENIMNDDLLAKNDTQYREIGYYAIPETVYAGLTDTQKTNYTALNEFLSTGAFEEGKWHHYLPETEDSYLPAGEYMVVALVSGTFNYKNIVTPGVAIEVKDRFVERTFTLKNLVLQDGEGNVLTDEDNDDYGEYVSMANSLKTSNNGKTVVCKQNGEVRGTVDFGGGAFDELQGEEAYAYTVNGNELTVIVNASVDGDSVSGEVVGEGKLDGNTFTLTIYINGTNYKFVSTFAG